MSKRLQAHNTHIKANRVSVYYGLYVIAEKLRYEKVSE